MTTIAKPFAHPRAEEHEDPREHLMHDPLPRGEMNAMVMDSMHSTSWKFWTVTGFLTFLVLTCFFYAWAYLILNGLGVAGVNKPVFWGIFLANTVFWIGISHAGTFISAILRVLKVESRRPFTRAAELMTTFGLVQAGASIFMHLGRVWLAYWLFPYPNERQLGIFWRSIPICCAAQCICSCRSSRIWQWHVINRQVGGRFFIARFPSASAGQRASGRI